MIDFTVGIPTYNRAKQLPLMLEKLRSQINTENISWEIIVVNNNSTDETAKVVEIYQADWPTACPLRSYLEIKQGAAFARRLAAQEGKGEFIGFLDDDVLPAPDWVASACLFGKEHPKVGVYGGQIHGNFEVAPPEDFKRIQGFLSVREHGPNPYRFDPDNLSLPTGAAFVVRKQAWCESISENPIFPGRVGKSMVGGEDLEVMLQIHKAGWETWYTPTMHAYHQIPYWRLEKNYLISLMYGCALCTCQLRLINASDWQKAIVIIRTILGNLRRLMQHLIRHGQKVATEIVPACEMAFLVGNLVSPFYFLKVLMIRRRGP